MTAASKSQRIDRTASITLHAPPERVFPLFGPVREAEWAKDWDPQIVYAGAPLAEEEGAVFITRHEGQAETVWIITCYEPQNYRIAYARVTPGSTAVRLIIHCEAAPNNETTAHVTYQVTPLNDSINDIGSKRVETHFPEMMAHWEAAINHALESHH